MEPMQSKLERLELQLARLLDTKGWIDTYVYGYRESVVFRIERPWEDCMVRLNYFQPDPTDRPPNYETLHPHRWRGAFRIVEGGYDMDLAYLYDEKDDAPTKISTLFFGAGASYSMEDPRLWHAVRKDIDTYTICLCGPEFPNRDLIHIAERRVTKYGRGRIWKKPMTVKEIDDQLAVYRKHYQREET